MKGLVKSGEPTNAYRNGATGLPLRPGDYLGADGVHLSGKGWGNFGHSLAELVRRALKFLGQGNLNPSHLY